MAGSEKPEAWLQDEAGEKHSLGTSFSVGRSSGCDLTLPDNKVSRKHAVINCQSGIEFWLSDLGSANGTYVNQVRVSQPVRLRAGDEIRIGPFQLQFVCPSDQTSAGDAATQMTTQQTLIDLRHERRWLLVADIENSTMLASSLEPAIYRRYVDEWFTRSKDAVTRGRGVVNKFLGDGFLACWGDTGPAADHVLATIDRFREMRDDLSFRFRLAVHVGEIILGGVGTTGEESLAGPEVNFAFRMEKLAGTNGISILVSEPAARAFGDRFQRGEPHEFAVSGFSGTYQFYEG